MSPEDTHALAATPPAAEPQSLPIAARGLTVPAARVAHPAQQPCANCGNAVTEHFCGHCGQRLEHEIHSLWHFTREATEDLTHADSRLWSTMFALLFKPGFLTQEFLAGRRVRYMPPLRLYLVLSVAFFLILGFSHHESRIVQLREGSDGKTSIEVVPAKGDTGFEPNSGETPGQRADRMCNAGYDGPWSRVLAPLIEQGCRKSILADGRTIFEALLHNLPRAMFIFVPLIAAVMKLLYWKPRRYYMEHLLFFVHNHAFAFALFGLFTLLSWVLPAGLDGWLASIVWSYFFSYLFISLRRVYGQGRSVTLMKYMVLAFTYFIGAAVTLALTVTYSVYSL